MNKYLKNKLSFLLQNCKWYFTLYKIQFEKWKLQLWTSIFKTKADILLQSYEWYFTLYKLQTET